jgi:hypothetical protein
LIFQYKMKLGKDITMKIKSIVTIIFILINFSLLSKSRGGVRMNITVPQFSFPSSNGVSYPVAPGLNPYFYNSAAYGNLLLNQNNANVNAMNARIPQPQSDLGAQYLDKQIQKEISDEIAVQPIQSGQSMPVYRITSINDHGRSDKNSDPKFKNADYLLWKFQGIEEGNTVQIKGNQLEFGQSAVFADKPDSLLKFVRTEKENYFLLESRANGNLTGLLVNQKTKKINRVQCTKSKDSLKENYEYAVIGEELEFWNYIGLFGNAKE